MTVRARRPLIALISSSMSFHKAVRDRLSVETIENNNDKVTSYRFFKEAHWNNIIKIVSFFYSPGIGIAMFFSVSIVRLLAELRDREAFYQPGLSHMRREVTDLKSAYWYEANLRTEANVDAMTQRTATISKRR